jgi:ABC-type molybdate transport system substrate-binding protein
MAPNMKRTLSPTLLSLVACLFAVAIRPASAAEIKVITTNLFQPGLVELAGQFKQATGHDVKIEAPRGPELTPDVKQAVLGADAVAYNAAPSGQQVQRVFDQMGISEQIKDKSTRPPNGAQTMQHTDLHDVRRGGALANEGD